MTAEVAVVNKGAVALAADSLVTVSSESGPEKTYNVNKLFTLSKYCPVGIMVYGNAEFMSVPWETVIKQFRKVLGKLELDTVQDYADHFLDWLPKSDVICPETHQASWLPLNIKAYFHVRIWGDIEDKVFEATKDGHRITPSEIREIVNNVVQEHLDFLESRDDRKPSVEGLFHNTINKYQLNPNEWIEEIFNKIPRPQGLNDRLHRIAELLLLKSIRFPDYSGVVIAGFGEREAFPVVRAFEVLGCTANKLVYDIDEFGSCNAGTSGVMPYAQRDVAQSFLLGADPVDLQTMQHYLAHVYDRLPKIIAEHLPENGEDSQEIVRKLENASQEALSTFVSIATQYLRNRHTAPLLEILNSLPKEELAELAESLVNLTTMKRKLSQGMETVGGPIDVAIISKGDGFVWIKRKHYFQPELNLSFVESYFSR